MNAGGHSVSLESFRRERHVFQVLALHNAGHVENLLAHHLAQLQACVPRRIVQPFSQPAQDFGQKDLPPQVAEEHADDFSAILALRPGLWGFRQ